MPWRECCVGLDNLVHGPLPTLETAIKQRDEEGIERWCKHAAWSGNSDKNLIDVLKLAVQRGDVNTKLPSGSNSLHLAIENLQVELVQQLLDAGASPEAMDAQGRKCMQIVQEVKRRNSSLEAQLKEHEIEQALEHAVHTFKNRRFMDSISFVAKVSLFSSLPPADLPRLAAAFTPKTYETGETIIKQGDKGSSLYVIESGLAVVKVLMPGCEEPVQVAELSHEDYFGEAALLKDVPRNATVEAKEPLLVHVLQRADFEQLDLRHKLRFKKRRAVAATEDAAVSKFSTLQHNKKSEAEREFIKGAMMKNTRLGPLLTGMSEAELASIVDQAFPVQIIKGQEVMQQGCAKADNFFVVETGALEVFVNGRKILELGPTDSFGELALLFHAPRAATVKATTLSKLWAIGKKALKKAAHKQFCQTLQEYENLLDKVEVLKPVSKENKAMLADALVVSTFYEGEYIIRQGEDGDSFFVLYEGEVDVEVDGKQVARFVGDPTKDEAKCFGEKALLEDEPRSASIKVASAKAKVLTLDRSVFLHVMDGSGTKKGASSSAELVEYQRCNLKVLGLLGVGGFGAVSLVKCKQTGNYFALKSLSKGHILLMCQTKSVMNERKILRMTNSPFLIRCAATFNGPQHLYFLLEPAMGGELFTVYQRSNLYGLVYHAQFYCASVIRGLAFLHDCFVIYRDLKSENVLLDPTGHCKITDFGLAKFTLGHTFTVCGTPDYFAPEMVAATGHTKAVDWWTLGVLIYELMTSDMPFAAEDAIGIFHNVNKGINSVSFPSEEPWTDLVRALCVAEPSERLPMRHGGVRNIEGHPWYAGFDWAGLDSRTIRPPFVPEVKGPEDLDNFDADPADMPPHVPYDDPRTGWDAEFEDPKGPLKFD